MSNVNKVLTEGELIVTGRLIDASNATLLAQCTLGQETIKCIYKPVAGERPLWDFPDGNLAQREFAAYLVSEFLKAHVVPLTILRDGPFGTCMVQEWIDIDESVDLALYFREINENLRKVALFDAVINNTDRKIGHLLPAETGHLFVCDHGVTFHEEDKLRTVLWQWSGQPLSADEMAILSSLKDAITNGLIAELPQLLSAIEIDALLMRIDRLISESTFPEPNPEWPAVPWPPF